jgi:hypothetical protein
MVFLGPRANADFDFGLDKTVHGDIGEGALHQVERK